MKTARHAIIPSRIFLDTCTVQAISDCGNFVFGEEDYSEIADCQILRRPDAENILQYLRSIFTFDERAHFEWIVSDTSLAETDQRGDGYQSSYIRDILDHSLICLSENPPSETGKRMAKILSSEYFSFISKKDRRLLVEAASAECDTFLTIEKRLPKNSDAVLRKIPLFIAEPQSFWSLLEPHVCGL